MTVRPATVSNVLSPFPDAQVTVEWSPTDRQTLTCTGWFYEPQVGDLLRVEMDAVKGQPYIVKVETAGRVPDIAKLVLTIQTSAPSGMQSADSVWVSPGRITAVVPTIAPSTAGGDTFPALSSHTYDATNGWGRSDNYLRQGAYPGGPPGTGLWFYGGFASLAGHTLTGITVTVKRVEGIGDPYAPKDIYVVGHTYMSQPGGAPSIVTILPGPVGKLGTGDQLTFTLPLSVATALQSGGLAGLGIASQSGSDYLAVYGAGSPSGTIDITWSA